MYMEKNFLLHIFFIKKITFVKEEAENSFLDLARKE